MGRGGQGIVLEKNLALYNMIFIYFFKIFLPISQSFLLNPEKVSKKCLISDNATLHDANSNALEGGGGISSKC